MGPDGGSRGRPFPFVRTGWGLLPVVVLVGGMVCGQEAPSPDSLLVAADSLATVTQAGETAPAGAVISGEGRPLDWGWSLRFGTAGERQEMLLAGDRWRMSCRRYRPVAAAPWWRGWVEGTPGSGVRLWAGPLAVAAGAGLVAGRPERSPSLVAGRFLSWRTPAVRRVAIPAAGPGVTARLQRGPWRLHLARRLVTHRSGGRSDLLVVTRRLGGRGALAGIAGRGMAGHFWSLLLVSRARPWRLGVELAGTWHSGSEPARVVELGWRERRRDVRLAVAAAPRAWRGPAGGRIALLPGGGGTGRALQWSYRGGDERRILLLAGGTFPLAGDDGWCTWRRVSLSWRRRGRWGEAGIRWRRDRKEEHHRDVAGGWLPAPAAVVGRRQRLVFWWVGRLAGHPAAAAWRLQEATDPGETRRRRQLLWWRWEGGAPDGWSWRLRWDWAWGDPLDLVTAVAPVPGRLLTRHWGRWRSGVTVGAWRWWRSVRLGVTVGLRRPAAGGTTDRFLEITVGSRGSRL